MKTTFIVRRMSDGCFLGRGGAHGGWKHEYPEANEYATLKHARAAAKKTGVICEVWEDYGLEPEHVAIVVHP